MPSLRRDLLCFAFLNVPVRRNVSMAQGAGKAKKSKHTNSALAKKKQNKPGGSVAKTQKQNRPHQQKRVDQVGRALQKAIHANIEAACAAKVLLQWSK